MGKLKPWLFLLLGLGLFSLLLIFLSCGSPKQLIPEAPSVVSVYPAASVEGVSIDSQITAKFDRDMDLASINNSSFTLASPEGSVTGVVTYDASIRTAIFTPQLPLAPSTVYTAIISTAVKSTDGGQMSIPYQWSFTTYKPTPSTIPGATTTTTITTTTTPTTIFSGWESVGSAGFSAREAEYISLAFDNGTYYIAYRDGANSYEATVMKFNGSAWESVGAPGFSAGLANYTSLAVYNGIPYIAYSDSANSNKATVMKFNGTVWENLGTAGFSAGIVQDISFVIYNGTPYVAFRDVGSGAKGVIAKATVMKFNGSTWENVGTAGFSAGAVFNTSLAVYNGIPYIAYSDSANSNKATVMKFNGSNWENVGTAGFSASYVGYVSLVIYNGTPYVAYSDSANSNKATVMKFNGSTWESVGTAGFSAGETGYISLAVYNGTPYVAYRDVDNIGKGTTFTATVMKYVGP